MTKLFHKNNKQIAVLMFAVLMVCAMFSCVLFMNTVQSALEKVRVIGVFGILVFCAFTIIYYIINRRILEYKFIFALVLFLFSFGQYAMYGVRIQYDYFFLNDFYASLFGYNYELLRESVLYSLCTLSSFFLAILITSQWKSKKASFSISNSTLKHMSLFFFIACYTVVIIYRLYLAYMALINGYTGVREINEPTLVRFFSGIIFPFLCATLISFRNNKKIYQKLCVCACVLAVLDLTIGSRTEAASIAACMFFIWMSKRKKKKSFLFYVLVGFVIYILISLMVTVALYRGVLQKNLFDFVAMFFDNFFGFRAVISLIGEMGFSNSSIVWTMYQMQHGWGYGYGLSYLGACVNAIPTSFDIFGILTGFEKYCYLDMQLTNAIGIDFGVGFSLVAESFYNFGWGGILVLFAYGLIMGRIFSHPIGSENWNGYVSLVLFATLLTLPRRQTLYLVDQIVSCIFIVWLVCKLSLLFQNAENSTYKKRTRHSRRGIL